MDTQMKTAAGAATPEATEIKRTPDSIAGLADAKALATIRAQFALHGFEVRDSIAGGWLVCRWGWARHCLDLAELLRLLQKIGGAA